MQPLELPPIPRSVSGLKNDGTRDKRYTGATYANLKRWMKEATGKTDSHDQI